MTLVPVVAAFGTAPHALRAVALLPLLLFAWLAYRRLGRVIDPVLAALAVGCAALSIEGQLGALRPLTDPPFAALTWGTFLVADREDAWSWKRVAGVALLGYGAIAYRVAGVALLPALVLYTWGHRHRMGWRPVVPAFLWGASGLAALAVGVVANPYADGMRGQWLFASHRLRMLANNYRGVLAESTLHPLGAGAGDALWQVLVIGLFAAGLPALVRSFRGTLVGAFALCYTAMLLTAPVGELRYAWPLFPLVVATVLLGVRAILGTLLGDAMARTRFAGATMLVAGLAMELRRPPPPHFEGDSDAEALFDFVRSQGGARVLFRNPRVLALRTGRAAMGLLDRTTPGQLAGIDERHLTHFVWQRPDLANCAQIVANAMVERYPERFRLAYSNATFRAFAVVPAAVPFTGPFEVADWDVPDRYCPGLVAH